MKNHRSIRSYLLGVLTTLMVVSLATPALAAAVQKTIQVSTGVHIFVDDVELRPTDANGDPVEVFVYNGTTYLPVRAVSEGLGKPVQWEGSTRSVYIGKHSSDKPAAYLNEMDYFTKERAWEFDYALQDNLGVEHLHSICRVASPIYDWDDGSITYKLNGLYSRLTGVYFQQYSKRDRDFSTTVVIKGDGYELWQGSVAKGMDPLNIDIDITGVLELTIEYPSSGGKPSYTALGDVALWT